MVWRGHGRSHRGADAGAFFLSRGVDIFPSHENRPVVRNEQPSAAQKDGGLAGTAWTHERCEPSHPHIEGDMVRRLYNAVRSAKDFAEIADLESHVPLIYLF